MSPCFYHLPAGSLSNLCFSSSSDPYGTPAMFLDSAVQAVTDGGLLAVTATDMPVLAGHHMEACWGKYTSQPVRGKFCQEEAVRILLHSIAAAAGRHKREIIPILSFAADHYVSRSLLRPPAHQVSTLNSWLFSPCRSEPLL